ncbi:SDR family NAD(P)-dependent oxidoreductase [Bradyrhizobium niftali]|uniref:SDR family oxidoreductase n=1 Tax=Bradyrhizobium niftali TaxID=2560055 RepID=A0A4Y9M7X2_9BRAD|nr:SDR family NAD(P)-dependent oxidoreductase [Bradyrhizobium niftali]TFV51242.1 SDR family oxidoreductase [Bradyrhizobium niftali]
MQLVGKTAVVTGGARGLGRAFALRLASLGADVAIIDIDLNAAAAFGEVLKAPSVAEEIQNLGRRGIGIQTDLTDREKAVEAIEQVYSTLGRIDILVNNAGGAITPTQFSAASATRNEDLRLLLDVNLFSTVNCCVAAAPYMSSIGGGVIVNMASTTGTTVYSKGVLAGYGATKAAIAHYTRYLAAELGPRGTRVNCMAPAIIWTSRVAAQAAARGVGTQDETASIPLRRFGSIEDCTGVLEFLTTPLSQYVTGQVISVCGGSVLTPS